MSPLQPGVQAGIDQDGAQLRDLVALAHRHQAGHCTLPGGCAGQAVAVSIVALRRLDRDRLLQLAISELARLRPAYTGGAPGEPAEDAIVRVDTPTGPGYYVRDDTLDEPHNDGDHWWPLVYAAAPLTWQQISADGPPVVLAPSTPDTQEGPTTP